MTLAPDALDLLAINTIRTLSIDAVQKANSGHPGAPMGMAPMAFSLWTRFLRHAPTVPDWPNRDRFVLSAGHASMLLYSLLHLTGYDLSLEQIESFRQWGSRTPGHPETGLTAGVEATTGPLGQGVANAVGMAIAERRLAHEFNRPDHDIIDHWTYAICSDGDMQEGIASEAASPRRSPQAAQAGDALRRQRHPARRAHRDGLLRECPRALRCLRLGHPRGHRRQRRRGDQRRDPSGPGGRPAEPDRRADPHRLRRAAQAGHARRPTARRSARTRSGSPRRPTAGIRTATSTSPTRRSTSSAGRSPRARPSSRRGTASSTATRPIIPTSPPSSSAGWPATLPEGWEAALPSYAVGEDFATRQVSQATINALAPVCRGCSAVPPTCPNRT